MEPNRSTGSRGDGKSSASGLGTQDFLKAAAAKRPEYFKDALPDGDVTGLSVREIKAAPRSRGVSTTQR